MNTELAFRMALNPQAGFGARGRLQSIWGASSGLNAGGEQKDESPYPNLQNRVCLVLGVLGKSE